MIGLVSAFEEGQCFTQQQINNYDVNTLTAMDVQLQSTGRNFINQNKLISEYKYLNFYWEESQQAYCLTFEIDFVGIEIQKLYDIHSRGYTWLEIFSRLKEHFKETAIDKTLTLLKNKIINYQEGTNERSFFNWLDGWDR